MFSEFLATFVYGEYKNQNIRLMAIDTIALKMKESLIRMEGDDNVR